MKRTHAFLIAVSVAIAVIAGSFAALRTTQLGVQASPRIDAALLTRQNRALDRAEAALRKQLATKPPALPRVPQAGAAAPAPRTVSAAGAAGPQRVIYVRPKPIIRVIHRSGGAGSEHDSANEPGHGDGGGGFDD